MRLRELEAVIEIDDRRHRRVGRCRRAAHSSAATQGLVVNVGIAAPLHVSVACVSPELA